MTRVRVYRNLTKDCWSIQEKTTKGWRVSRYRDLGFTLNDCKFIVHKGGQNRVRRENKKYVHAYVEGIPDCIVCGEQLEERIKYNPHRDDYFNIKENNKLDYCDRIVFTHSGYIYTSSKRWYGSRTGTPNRH